MYYLDPRICQANEVEVEDFDSLIDEISCTSNFTNRIFMRQLIICN